MDFCASAHIERAEIDLQGGMLELADRAAHAGDDVPDFVGGAYAPPASIWPSRVNDRSLRIEVS